MSDSAFSNTFVETAKAMIQNDMAPPEETAANLLSSDQAADEPSLRNSLGPQAFGPASLLSTLLPFEKNEEEQEDQGTDLSDSTTDHGSREEDDHGQTSEHVSDSEEDAFSALASQPQNSHLPPTSAQPHSPAHSIDRQRTPASPPFSPPPPKRFPLIQGDHRPPHQQSKTGESPGSERKTRKDRARPEPEWNPQNHKSMAEKTHRGQKKRKPDRNVLEERKQVWQSRQAEHFLLKYRLQYEVRCQLHLRAAAYYSNWHLALGVPATLFNFLTGPSLIAVTVAGEILPKEALISIALVLVIGAFLMALLVGLKPSQKSKQHELTAAQCLDLKRKIEIEESMPAGSHEISYRSFVTLLLIDIEKEQKQSLRIPQHIADEFLPVQAQTIKTEIRLRELRTNFQLDRVSVRDIAAVAHDRKNASSDSDDHD